MMPGTRPHQRGFTLIEVIIMFVVAAILGTMIVTYFGSSILESGAPITRLRASTDLHRVTENITADYSQYPKWRSGATYTTASKVIPKNPNGYYYQCSQGGTSGTTEPSWPLNTTPYTESTGVQWTKGSLTLREILPLTTLSSNIGAEGSIQTTNPYGKNPDGVTYAKYTVVKNNFIKFVNDIEQDIVSGDPSNILKVTLENETGERLTALFVAF